MDLADRLLVAAALLCLVCLAIFHERDITELYARTATLGRIVTHRVYMSPSAPSAAQAPNPPADAVSSAKDKEVETQSL